MAPFLRYSLPQLPESIRKQVEDFIEFLMAKYQTKKKEGGGDPGKKYPLRGSVIHYDDPFGPAAEADEWDTLK
jgi:hypothetical protein